LFQRPQDLLIRHSLIALDLKIPDKKGAPQQQQGTDPQGDPQAVTVPHPPQKKRRSPPAHRCQLTVQLGGEPPQPLPVPPCQSEGKRRRRLPLEVPECKAIFPAQVQNPLREAALHPGRDLPLQQVDNMFDHITSPTPPAVSSPGSAGRRRSCSPAPDRCRTPGSQYPHS